MPSLHRAGEREPVSRRPPRHRDLRLLLVVIVLGASAMATMAYVAYLLWPRWPEFGHCCKCSNPPDHRRRGDL